MKALLGVASWARISMASTPPMVKNTSASTMKRLPRILWFTADRRPQPDGVPQIRSSAL